MKDLFTEKERGKILVILSDAEKRYYMAMRELQKRLIVITHDMKEAFSQLSGLSSELIELSEILCYLGHNDTPDKNQNISYPDKRLPVRSLGILPFKRRRNDRLMYCNRKD